VAGTNDPFLPPVYPATHMGTVPFQNTPLSLIPYKQKSIYPYSIAGRYRKKPYPDRSQKRQEKETDPKKGNERKKTPSGLFHLPISAVKGFLSGQGRKVPPSTRDPPPHEKHKPLFCTHPRKKNPTQEQQPFFRTDPRPPLFENPPKKDWKTYPPQ